MRIAPLLTAVVLAVYLLMPVKKTPQVSPIASNPQPYLMFDIPKVEPAVSQEDDSKTLLKRVASPQQNCPDGKCPLQNPIVKPKPVKPRSVQVQPQVVYSLPAPVQSYQPQTVQSYGSGGSVSYGSGGGGWVQSSYQSSSYTPRWHNHDGLGFREHAEVMHGINTSGMSDAQVAMLRDHDHDVYGPGHNLARSQRTFAPIRNTVSRRQNRLQTRGRWFPGKLAVRVLRR